MPVLTRSPVVLRPFTEADVGLVQSVADDPLIPLITTVPSSGSRADALAFIRRQHDRLTSGAGYSFAIADETTGEPVGQIGLWLRDLDAGRASTGYWIAPRYRRRGYVFAALDAISRWGLSLDGLHRIELHVEPWNEGSWRAAERVGYVREGLMRGYQQIGTERRDLYLYGLLPVDLEPDIAQIPVRDELMGWEVGDGCGPGDHGGPGGRRMRSAPGSRQALHRRGGPVHRGR